MRGKGKIFSLIVIALVTFVSGCSTVVFRGSLSDGESFYLQSVSGATTLMEISENVVEVDEQDTVGGFIESPIGDSTVYWVPDYTMSTNGNTNYQLITDEGKPTKIAKHASFNGLLIDPMDPNRILVSINVLDENNENVDGYTHVYVKESDPTQSISFFDFDHVDVPNIQITSGDLQENDQLATEPLGEGWKMADSTSTIFGYYNVGSDFFDKLDGISNSFKETINPLLESLGENTANPQEGVSQILVNINDTVWANDSFSLNLSSGNSNALGTVQVPLPKLTTTLTGKAGKVSISWPEVFGTVEGYKIYQDGEEIDTVDSGVTSYDVEGLTIGQSYEFSIRGIIPMEEVLVRALAAPDNTVETVFALSANQLVEDDENPVITLNGENPLTLAFGTLYEEPGYSASDNSSTDLTDEVVVTGTVDNNVPGTYTLTYTVSDAAGNQTAVTRTVQVVDAAAPVITLHGDNPLTIKVGSKYEEPGYTAVDDVDGDVADLVVETGTVDNNVPGTYTLTYTVSDAAGNQTAVTRTVQVVDAAAPVITLHGDNPLTIKVGSKYEEPGYTAVDDVDGDVADKVVVTSDVDTNTPGEYTVTYTVYDQASNKAELTRIVIVEAIADGVVLPNTAANQYNLLFAGALFGLIGFMTLLVRRRKSIN